MTDTAIGFLLLGIGIVFVLGLVFALTWRLGRARGRVTPPEGVHMPGPSWLPLAFSVGAALIGAGLAFRPDVEGALANWWFLIPGLVIFVLSALGWVRAAGREWVETERGGHHDPGRGH
jgi:hypothetical protein